MYCNKYRPSLRSSFIAKIKVYTLEQLVPIMVQTRSEHLDDEIKNLLDPERLSENFGEALHKNIKDTVKQNRLHLFKPANYEKE